MPIALYSNSGRKIKPMNPILIVDDNEQILTILSQYIQAQGWPYLTAKTGEDALRIFDSAAPSVILLDIMLPGISGLETCRRIRQSSMVPILMITAKDEDADRILGLDIGADDYIVKPFSPGEVMARIRAILRRMHTDEKQETLVLDELSINLKTYTVLIAGQQIALTHRETELLYMLAENPGRVFTRENLLNMVWGYEYLGSDRAVDSHIKRLRQKIDAVAHPSFALSTVWGVGYKLERIIP